MLNALTIDLEEWYHPELVRHHLSPLMVKSQIEEATRPVLRLLESYNVLATFFVVGEVALAAPNLIREIVGLGHEIGCHGMTHQPLHSLQPDGLRAELIDYQTTMASLGIVEVAGFRAPTFSLDNRTRWAIPILRELGYQYDSSVFPIQVHLYGVPDCPPTPYRVGEQDVTRPDPHSDLWEFPMSTFRWGRWKVPVSGGFYLRSLPLAVLEKLLKRINAQGQPFVIYLHPWEMYSETPRLKELPWLSRWVTYVNIRGTLTKLEHLLRAFPFSTMQRALSCWRAENPDT